MGRARATARSARETAEADAPGTAPATIREGGIESMEWGSVRLMSRLDIGHVRADRRTKPAALFVGPSYQGRDAGEETAGFFLLGA